MARKIFCDDCGKEINLQDEVKIDFYYRLPNGFEMCYACFIKH